MLKLQSQAYFDENYNKKCKQNEKSFGSPSQSQIPTQLLVQLTLAKSMLTLHSQAYSDENYAKKCIQHEKSFGSPSQSPIPTQQLVGPLRALAVKNQNQVIQYKVGVYNDYEFIGEWARRCELDRDGVQLFSQHPVYFKMELTISRFY